MTPRLFGVLVIAIGLGIVATGHQPITYRVRKPEGWYR